MSDTDFELVRMNALLVATLVRKGVLTLAEMREILGHWAPSDDQLVALGLDMGLVENEDNAREQIGRFQ